MIHQFFALLFALSLLLTSDSKSRFCCTDALHLREIGRPRVRGVNTIFKESNLVGSSLLLHAAAKSETTKRKQPKSKETVETVRKKEFVATMAEELGYTKTDAEASLTCALELISDCLAEGKKVNFPGFGTFEPRSRKARKGRNPKTGEEIQIQASVAVGFSAAKGLKERVNEKE